MTYTVWTTGKDGKRMLFANYNTIKKALKAIDRCASYASMVSVELVKEYIL